jgi:lipopolysaccharide transport system permease protein
MIRNLRELYQYRALLWNLTLRELKARYRASVLGFLWTFLNPTLQMAVYSLMFGLIIKQDIPHYPYFIFVGMLPWIFFSSSVLGGTSAISDRRDLLTKVRFPPQVLPATVVTTNLANYLLSLPLMFGLGLLSDMVPSWHVVFFVPILLLQVLFTLAATYVLSALNVAFRDLQHIVGNLLMLAFFGTPVLWPITRVNSDLTRKLLMYCNPMGAIVIAYRDIFYDHQIPNWHPLAAVAVESIVMLWVASIIFERRREEFAELI